MSGPSIPSGVPSPNASRARAASGRSCARARASRTSAVPLAYCSQQPRWPQPQGRPSGTTPDVAELRRHAEVAAVQPAAEDDAAADAGPDGHADDVVARRGGTEARLAPGRGVRVVLDDDGRPGRRSSSRARSGSSRQPRLAANRTTERGRVDEPGAPTPTATTSDAAAQLGDGRSSMRLLDPAWVVAGVARRRSGEDRPVARRRRRPATFVPPMSIPIA